MLGRPASERGVAAGQEFKMAQISAVEAKGFVVFQSKQIALQKFPAALAALGVGANLEDHDFVGLFRSGGIGFGGLHHG